MPALPSFCPVEGRAVEEVGELLAVARVVDPELLLPGPRLDLRLEHHASGPS